MRWFAVIGCLAAVGCSGDSITDGSDAAPLGPCGEAEPVWEQPFATLDDYALTQQGAAKVTLGEDSLTFLLAGAGSGRVDSAANYPLASSTLTVEVDPPGSTVGSRSYVGLVEGVEESPQVMEIAISDEELRVESRIDDLSRSDVMIEFDETAHRYWRVRSDASSARFEVSADGTSWTELQSYALADTFEYRLRLGMIGLPSPAQEVTFLGARWCQSP